MPTRDAMLTSLAVTGGVITSAGVVLAGTFAVLAVLPLIALTQLGITVALGVLLDTLVVRSILVPALTFELGERTWWPARFRRERTAARLSATVTRARLRRGRRRGDDGPVPPDLNHVSVVAHDLEASLRFYVDELGLEPLADAELRLPRRLARERAAASSTSSSGRASRRRHAHFGARDRRSSCPSTAA